MRKIAIVVDTNSSIDAVEAEELGVFLLQMPIIVDGQEYIEGRDITYDEFFERLGNGAEVSTSQPSPESVTSLWDQVLQEYDELLHFPMSAALSSSCATAKALAVDYGDRVHVIDNRRISITLRSSVMDAIKLVKSGKYSGAEIAERLEAAGPDQSIYIAVNTLELLKKSGRVTAAGAALASVLSIKPVLTIQGGKLDAYQKCRGMNAAEKCMLKVILSELEGRFAGKEVRLDVAYSGSRESAEKWLASVRKFIAEQEAFAHLQVTMARLPLSICCHIAEGAHALGISEVYKD